MEEPAESWATRRYGARRVASPARKNQNSAPRAQRLVAGDVKKRSETMYLGL